MESLDRPSDFEVSEINLDVVAQAERLEGQAAHRRKKVGSYVLHLDNVLGKGSFAKVYYGEKLGFEKGSSHVA